MKRVMLFCAFFLALNAVGQDLDRIEVKGKIIVEKSDIEGISILNKSSKAYVFTNESGEFTIKVKQDDLLEISALQYQNITFKINKAVIDSRLLKIFLIEEINVLDEVIISSNRLTGNLTEDINLAPKEFAVKQDAYYFGIPNDYSVMKSNSANFTAAALDPSHNVGMNPERASMINGLDIINVVDLVLLPLFRSEVKDKKSTGIPEVPVESIKYYFGSDFLVQNFNIPEHRVEEFIRFVESENFDFSLLNYGHEMEFLELLNQKSVEFLNKKI